MNSRVYRKNKAFFKVWGGRFVITAVCVQFFTHKALRQTVIKQESNEGWGGAFWIHTKFKHFRGSSVVVTSFFELGGGGGGLNKYTSYE